MIYNKNSICLYVLSAYSVYLEISAECPDDFIQNEKDCPEYEKDMENVVVIFSTKKSGIYLPIIQLPLIKQFVL